MVSSKALLALAVAGVLLGGCAASGGSKLLLTRTSHLEHEVRGAGFEPHELTFPFLLTDDMKTWVHATVPKTARPQYQLQALLDGLLGPNDLGVRYEAGYTPTAHEVFADRRANCLAFTHTYVGLAREVGLDAYFLDVLHVQSFEKDRDLIVESGHVTAGYGLPNNRLVLEYNVGPSADYTYVRQLTDLEALALYYSNRGAETLRAGQATGALELLRTAVTLNPELAEAWVNYGVVLRRLGESEAAQEAYRRALEVDPNALSAYQNLAALLRLEGQSREADDLLRAADRLGSRNPYAYLNLGDIQLRRGRFPDAERFYRKALNLYQDFADPYAALGLLAYEKGHFEEARRWLRKAEKKDPDNSRTAFLARRLDPNSTDDRALARIVPVSSGT